LPATSTNSPPTSTSKSRPFPTLPSTAPGPTATAAVRAALAAFTLGPCSSPGPGYPAGLIKSGIAIRSGHHCTRTPASPWGSIAPPGLAFTSTTPGGNRFGFIVALQETVEFFREIPAED
jgi:hypothetical protein